MWGFIYSRELKANISHSDLHNYVLYCLLGQTELW